jgi:AraC-like DNA-binding protein
MERIDNCIVADVQDVQRLLAANKNTAGIVSVKSFSQAKNLTWSSGRFDLYEYREVAYAGIKDFSIDEAFTTKTSLSNLISFEYMLNGGSDQQLAGKTFLNNDMPRLYVTSHGKSSKQSRFHKAGEKYKGVGIWITPDKLEELFSIHSINFPYSITQVLNAKINRVLTFPLTGNMRRVVDQTLNHPFSEKLSYQFVESKLTELLCYTLLCMQSPEHAYNNDNQLSNTKNNAMKLLLSRLEGDLEKIPSVDELSKELGMSKAQLTKTFKSSYGMTISEYLTQKRMQRSQDLIKEGKLSILQVAIEVGYLNQSSFGRAFKKFFGYSPLKDKTR